MKPLIDSIPIDLARIPGERLAWLAALGLCFALVLIGPVTLGATLTLFGMVLLSVVANAIYLSLWVGWLRANSATITAEGSPVIYAAAEQCAQVLGLRAGCDYVLGLIPHARPNAYAIGFFRPYLIIIHSAMSATLSDDPALWRNVLGHEMLHCVRDDPRKMLLTGITGSASASWSRWIALPTYLAFSVVRQYLEGAADRAGLILAGGIQPTAETLARLCGHGALTKEINYPQIMQAEQQYARSVFGQGFQLLSTHPSLGGRIYALCQWVQSPEFAYHLGFPAAERERRVIQELGLLPSKSAKEEACRP